MEVNVPNMENSDLGKIQVAGADLNLGDTNSNWKYLGIKKDAGKTIYLYGYNQALSNEFVTEPLFTKFNALDYTKYLSDKELSIDITARCVQTEGQESPSLEGYKVFSDGLDFQEKEIKVAAMSKDKFKAAFNNEAVQFTKSSTAPPSDLVSVDFQRNRMAAF